MLSKTSVDELFMHNFEKMSSASGGFALRPPPGSCPWTLLGTSVLQTPSLSTPGKSCVRPWVEISDVVPLEAARPASRFSALISQPILRPISGMRNNIKMHVCLCINITQMTVTQLNSSVQQYQRRLSTVHLA